MFLISVNVVMPALYMFMRLIFINILHTTLEQLSGSLQWSYTFDEL